MDDKKMCILVDLAEDYTVPRRKNPIDDVFLIKSIEDTRHDEEVCDVIKDAVSKAVDNLLE